VQSAEMTQIRLSTGTVY